MSAELLKAIELTARCELEKEYEALSQECQAIHRQLPDDGIPLEHHNIKLMQLAKRIQLLFAILYADDLQGSVDKAGHMVRAEDYPVSLAYIHPDDYFKMLPWWKRWWRRFRFNLWDK